MKPVSGRRWRRVASTVWLWSLLLVAGWVGWRGLPAEVWEPAGAVASVAPAVRSTEVAPESRYRFRAIETLKPGDWVLAADEHSGAVSPRRVLQTFVRRSDHLRLLDFEDASGSVQRLETTDEHPFWATDRRTWVNAAELQPGEAVQGPDGERLLLAHTQREDHPDGVTVYNFEVDTDHTYFVASPTSTAAPVLVHNANYADDVAPTSGRPSVNSSLPDRVTQELPAGGMRTPAEVKQARNFFERNREAAEKWWSERNGGQPWPKNATHAEHPRPLKDGGDPLLIEPGLDGSTAPHMIPGPDGLTDFQRWGRLGGRPPNQ